MRAGLAQAGPLAAAGLAANAANVVVTVLLARLLVARGYGALNQLTGVFLVVSMPGSALIVAVVRRATRGYVTEWARRQHRRGQVGVVAFSAAVVVVGPLLAGLLGRASAVGIDAMAAAGALWVLLCFDRGLLQSQRAYRGLSANMLAEGILRTVCVLGLVGAGLGVNGAAIGMLVAEGGTAVHARLMARRVLVRDQVGAIGTVRTRWDLAAALVALTMIALLQNADVLVIGREGPRVAGAYAAVSVSCKALVFAALVVGGYLLPEAAIRWRSGGHALHQLVVTLMLLGVPSAVLVAVAAAAPRRFLSILFSDRYVGASGAFLPLALAMVFLSCTVVLTMYLLAVGERRVTWVLVAGAGATVAAVAGAHGHARSTALADLCVQASVCIAAVAWLWLVHRGRVGPGLRSTPVTCRTGGGLAR